MIFHRYTNIDFNIVVGIFFVLFAATLSIPFVLVFSYIFLSAYIVQYRKSISIPLLYSIIACLLLLMLIIPLLSLDVRRILLASNFLISFLLCWFIKRSCNDSLIRRSINFMLLVYMVVFFCVVEVYHYMGVHYNDILPSASRNRIGAIIIFCFVLYAAFHPPKKLDLLFSVLMLFYALIIGGRSFQIISIIFCAYFFFVLYRTLFFFLLLLVLFCMFISFLVYEEFLLSINLESPRWTILDEYLDSLSLKTFLLGSDIRNIFWIDYYGGNPHNSLILGHYVFGLSYFVFLFIVLLKVFFYNGLHATFLVGVMVLKSATDLVAIPSSFDIFFFLVVFLSKGNSKLPICLSRLMSD